MPTSEPQQIGNDPQSNNKIDKIQNSNNGENEQILNDVRNSTTLIKVLSQDLVVISVDKIRIAYTEHMANKSFKDAWLGPAGILVSMILSLLTSSFSDSFGISGATWKALFIFGAVSAGIWTVRLAYKAITADSVTVEAFIKKITIEKSKPE